jgi:hypothetical protein
MEKLKSLKLKKLLKELDYLEDNYIYTQEIINEADFQFMDDVSSYLDSNPNVKEAYNTKIEENNKKILEQIKKSDEKKDENSNNQHNNNSKKEPSKEVKKLYREIVKLTHPDKVEDENLNNIYIESTKLYENDDKIGLYKICDKLNIKYEVQEDDEDFIVYKINEFKKKIIFLESTFTWKWLNTKDDKGKNDILNHFIQLKIK